MPPENVKIVIQLFVIGSLGTGRLGDDRQVDQQTVGDGKGCLLWEGFAFKAISFTYMTGPQARGRGNDDTTSNRAQSDGAFQRNFM